jgi:hypothetical protein
MSKLLSDVPIIRALSIDSGFELLGTFPLPTPLKIFDHPN